MGRAGRAAGVRQEKRRSIWVECGARQGEGDEQKGVTSEWGKDDVIILDV